MYRPSIPRLLKLFARTAVVRFRNRFAFARQKRQEAKRKKLGLPEPVRTATAHRNQKFRAGSILGWLFMAYMIFAFVMMVAMSLGKAMTGVLKIKQPGAIAAAAEAEAKKRNLTPEQKAAYARRHGDSIDDPLQKMNADTRRSADRVAGLLMSMAGLGTLLFALGMLSRQISRPEPSLAWLFEFPVPRGVLFSSKLCECLFDGASLPLLSMLPGVFLFQSGLGFWESAGWGLAFGAIAALGVGAVRIALEVFLLQKCPRRRRGTIGGFAAALGTLLMVVVLYGGGTPALLRIMLDAAEFLPGWFYYNPLTNGFGLQPSSLPLQWLTSAGIAAACCVVSVWFCASLTRYGLEPGLETARGAAPASSAGAGGTALRSSRRPRFTGLLAKEMYMLVRQRALLVQILLAPIIMVMIFYFQTSGRFAERAMGNAGAMASTIFGICAYMVFVASQVAMNTELRTLWLLLSLPRPLADALRVKSRIWGTAAGGLALILGLFAVATHSDMAGGLLLRLPFIAVFVWLIADLSIGLRTMGSSIISETTVHFRQWSQWVPLFLSAAAGHAVFAGDLWYLSVLLILLSALDVSVWQKLNVELPYVTEPAEDPPPRLFLMHGLLAACGYLALQFLGLQMVIAAKGPVGKILPFLSAGAAIIVAGLAWWQLTRRHVRILPDERAPSLSVVLTSTAGLATACFIGWAWLQTWPLFEWGRFALQMSRGLSLADTGTRVSIFMMTVIVAPLCEEFLFRGLIYHGLRRTTGFLWSLLWTSLFFTAVHPPASSVAVFGLAAVNAWIMERTGRLTPCILVHAGYNAFVFWFMSRPAG